MNNEDDGIIWSSIVGLTFTGAIIFESKDWAKVSFALLVFSILFVSVTNYYKIRRIK